MSGDFTDVIKRGPVKIKGRRLGVTTDVLLTAALGSQARGNVCLTV